MENQSLREPANLTDFALEKLENHWSKALCCVDSLFIDTEAESSLWQGLKKHFCYLLAKKKL